MDQYMAFASGISFAREQWRSEEAYDRHHDRHDARLIRNWPIATAAALLVAMFVVSGVSLG